eukprot:gb/GECH01006568.1/.p1 GENE.gb/GECH01006568.1/~~gb/GECH01006568.1/.p1  ORF type:complete len:102 (+),score=36.71 gb/GECH01006568.1/:1-306(+)
MSEKDKETNQNNSQNSIDYFSRFAKDLRSVTEEAERELNKNEDSINNSAATNSSGVNNNTITNSSNQSLNSSSNNSNNNNESEITDKNNIAVRALMQLTST